MSTNETQQKTEQEIQALKHDWVNDPIWDIEETQGFEAHREELLDYRHRMEAIWEKEAKERKLRSSRFRIDEAIAWIDLGDFTRARAESLLSIAISLNKIEDSLAFIAERMDN